MNKFYDRFFPRLVWLSAVTGVSVAIAVVPNTAARGQASLKVDHEQLITAQRGAAIEPRAIVLSGNTVVVAGGINGTRQAWAAKVDLATGKLVWEHAVDILPSDQAIFGKQYGIHPRYVGAVSVPDGTTYICGSMPRPRGEYSPGLLSHIGANGEVLSEEMITPEQRNALGAVMMDDCTRWTDGIALLGGITHFAMPEDTNTRFPQNTRRAWIVGIDASGKKVFDVQVQAGADSTIRDPGTIEALPDGSIIVGLTNNIVSDFFRLDSHGAVVAHNSFSGRFLLVRTTNGDTVQIFGALAAPTNNTRAIALLTLDKYLRPTNEVEGSYARGFLARAVYRLGDHTLVLFGSLARTGLFASGMASGILRADDGLRIQDYFELPRQKIDDEHSIWAAGAAQYPGEFAVATEAIVHGLDPNHPQKPGDIPNFRLGAAIDTLTVK